MDRARIQIHHFPNDFNFHGSPISQRSKKTLHGVKKLSTGLFLPGSRFDE